MRLWREMIHIEIHAPASFSFVLTSCVRLLIDDICSEKLIVSLVSERIYAAMNNNSFIVMMIVLLRLEQALRRLWYLTALRKTEFQASDVAEKFVDLPPTKSWCNKHVFCRSPVWSRVCLCWKPWLPVIDISMLRKT